MASHFGPPTVYRCIADAAMKTTSFKMFNATEGVCRVRRTCPSYKCPSPRTQQPGPLQQSKNCTTDANCNDMCCTSLCTAYRCPPPKITRPGLSPTVTCTGSACDQTCCGMPCSNVTCPANMIKKTEVTATTVCGSRGCTATCCTPVCHAMSQSLGYHGCGVTQQNATCNVCSLS
jgi:hypothetical protein